MSSNLADQILKILTNNSVHLHVNRGEIKREVTYTAPSPGTYDQQWFWDSCLHSLVWME